MPKLETGHYVVVRAGLKRTGHGAEPYVMLKDYDPVTGWPDWAYQVALSALLADKLVYVEIDDKDQVTQILALHSAGYAPDAKPGEMGEK